MAINLVPSGQITAFAGGGQSSATPIDDNVVTVVCATDGDSLALPRSRPGATLIVLPKGPGAAQLFANKNEPLTIIHTYEPGLETTLGSVGVPINPSTPWAFFCVAAGEWWQSAM